MLGRSTPKCRARPVLHWTGRQWGRLVAALALCHFAFAAAAADLRIIDGGLSAGYATIGWPQIDGRTFELQIDDGTGWRTIYEGPDRARTMSGLPDGRYGFRVRTAGGTWSAPLVVEVAHHSLARAAAFFGTGAVVFLTLIVLLISGRSASRRPD